MSDKEKIVISGVNIRKGGTLTIMRGFLKWLSESELADRYEIVAIVHSRSLFTYEKIRYVEFPDSIRNWGRRLHYEYRHFRRLSEELGEVALWLSLHDTSPRVKARVKAVYCQTSYPFYRFRWRDFAMDYKIPLFSMFTRFVYKFNSDSTDRFIVQQKWMLEALAETINQPLGKFILFPPTKPEVNPAEGETAPAREDVPLFFFPSTPDCHKNFESLLEAARLLEKRIGKGKFKVKITITGEENKYARWLREKWGSVDSVDFCGFLSRKELFSTYQKADCLIFPSLIESWGLPISEFLPYKKPMILGDLPYAHETALGAEAVNFVDTRKPAAIAAAMEQLVRGELSGFNPVEADAATDEEYGTAVDLNQVFTMLLDLK